MFKKSVYVLESDLRSINRTPVNHGIVTFLDKDACAAYYLSRRGKKLSERNLKSAMRKVVELDVFCMGGNDFVPKKNPAFADLHCPSSVTLAVAYSLNDHEVKELYTMPAIHEKVMDVLWRRHMIFYIICVLPEATTV